MFFGNAKVEVGTITLLPKGNGGTVKMEQLITNETKQQYVYMDKCREIIKKKAELRKKPFTANIKTFGCQMNARDSEKLAGILEEIGYVDNGENENSDFVIFSLTAQAATM